jgi:DNA-binding winged helix-turn-helix (wHTH) protein
MRWKIGKYQFEAQTNVLLTPTGKRLLEPKASALLKYFLENQGRDISRDELIQSVWDGQIVTDGAINRIVVQLRRELGDEAKIKHTIVTVPKVGYRFVFPAYQQEDEPTTVPNPAKLPTYSLMVFIIAGLAFWLWPTQFEPQSQNANISPMVRLTSAQSDAALAAHSGHLAYVQKQGTGSALYLAAQADAPAVQIGQLNGHVSAPTWSSENNYLVYRHTNGANCAFRLMRFVGGVPTSDSAIYQCAPYGPASFAFNKTATYLYFTEQEKPFAPSYVYELDMETRSTRRLAQPTAHDKGNHHLDMHPTTDRLLMLRDRAPGMTTAYVLNVSENSYQKLVDWPYQVDYAIWGHSPGTIVHPGEHPSYRLLETAIDTGDTRLLVSDSRRIKEPARINNGQDYLFTSYIFNQDVHLNDQEGATSNSSVMDYLATLSGNGGTLAFISKRTGTSLIWIQDLETNTLRSIDPGTGGQKLRAMAWGPNNESLLLTTSSGLIVIDVSSGKIEHALQPKSTAFAASWIGDTNIVYSLNKGGRWHLYQHSFADDRSSTTTEPSAFLLKNKHREIQIDQQLRVFEGNTEILSGKCAPLLRLQDLTIRLDGEDLYCINKANPRDLIRMNKRGDISLIADAVSSTRHYSVAKGQIARTDTTSIVSDIMRTQYQRDR